MMDLKPWYLSKTIWASLATVALSLLAVAGVPTAGLDGGILADHIVAILTALSGAVALWGRVSAIRAIA